MAAPLTTCSKEGQNAVSWFGGGRGERSKVWEVWWKSIEDCPHSTATEPGLVEGCADKLTCSKWPNRCEWRGIFMNDQGVWRTFISHWLQWTSPVITGSSRASLPSQAFSALPAKVVMELGLVFVASELHFPSATPPPPKRASYHPSKTRLEARVSGKHVIRTAS
jgi:hypothetical protein